MRILRGRMETFPFWACRLPVRASSRSAGSNSRHLRAFVENPDYSRSLEASPFSTSSLSPFPLALRRLIAILPLWDSALSPSPGGQVSSTNDR